MSDYSTYDKGMKEALVASIHECAGGSKTSTDQETVEFLEDMVNGIPIYQGAEFTQAHRGTLATLMGIYCSSSEIALPDLSAGYWFVSASNYNNYKQAFYHGVSGNGATDLVYALVTMAQLTESYWRGYNTCLLTDAMRNACSVYIDHSAVDNDLNYYHNLIIPSLQNTVRGVMEEGYPPMSQPNAAIQNKGTGLDAAKLLDESICKGLFTNNVNAVMNNPPEGPNAATWFLYCLFTTLNVLAYGHGTIDAHIPLYEEAGLIVPHQIQSANWWQGEYVNWFPKMNGNDLINPAADMVKKPLPGVVYYTNTAWIPPIPIWGGIEEGYAISFCELGGCANYYNGTHRTYPWE